MFCSWRANKISKGIVMLTKIKGGLFFLFILFFSTSTIFAVGMEGLENVIGKTTALINATGTLVEKGTIAVVKIADIFTGKEIAALTASLSVANLSLINKEVGLTAMRILNMGMRGSLYAAQGANKSLIADKAVMITNLKWAAAIGGGAIVVCAVGAFAWHCYDKHQQEKKIEEQEKKVAASDLKSAFYECLATHKKSAKESDGLPTACKALAQEFLATVGQEKYDNIKNAYNA